MANRAEGKVSLTPIVTVGPSGDYDAHDVLHNDVDQILSGTLIYNIVNANDRWFYSKTTDISSNANLISGNFSDAAVAIASADIVKFLFIYNTGTSDGSDVNAQNIYLTFDGGDPVAQNDSVLIGFGESFIIKPKACTIDNLHAMSASGTVRCTVMAIIDDTSGSD
tara:strand:- start:60 stop:557 length:498 start_codon:yes stop_codon:yes gene_type:complete